MAFKPKIKNKKSKIHIKNKIVFLCFLFVFLIFDFWFLILQAEDAMETIKAGVEILGNGV